MASSYPHSLIRMKGLSFVIKQLYFNLKISVYIKFVGKLSSYKKGLWNTLLNENKIIAPYETLGHPYHARQVAALEGIDSYNKNGHAITFFLQGNTAIAWKACQTLKGNFYSLTFSTKQQQK